MIELYTWRTANGRKANIMVEETGIVHELHPVAISKNEQKRPEYLAINRNGKIPAIVDRDGPLGQSISVFESGAILLYLGEKTGTFLPTDPRAHIDVIAWLMFQMGGVGPMFGQAEHFVRFASQRVRYAIDRFTHECRRLLEVLERRLKESEYLVRDYSIADIATFPWILEVEAIGLNLDTFPNVHRWRKAIAARPAVQRGLALPSQQ